MTGTPLRQPLCLKVAGEVLREEAAQPPPSASPADVQPGQLEAAGGGGSRLFGNGNGWAGRGRTPRLVGWAGGGEENLTRRGGSSRWTEGWADQGPPGSCQLQGGVESSENGGTEPCALGQGVMGSGGKGFGGREVPRGSRKDTVVPSPHCHLQPGKVRPVPVLMRAQRDGPGSESRTSRIFQFWE